MRDFYIHSSRYVRRFLVRALEPAKYPHFIKSPAAGFGVERMDYGDRGQAQGQDDANPLPVIERDVQKLGPYADLGGLVGREIARAGREVCSVIFWVIFSHGFF